MKFVFSTCRSTEKAIYIVAVCRTGPIREKPACEDELQVEDSGVLMVPILEIENCTNYWDSSNISRGVDSLWVGLFEC